ncbi:MAG: hypothetical protein VZS44_05435 [Bacilli bacterium]|nr:hypothetical protein [Bacilli bacterium]
MLGFGVVVHAATKDSTPPVLKSASLVTNTVSYGDNICINVDATDNVGIWIYHFDFYNVNLKQYFSQESTVIDNKKVCVKVPDGISGGSYILASLSLADNAGNWISYCSDYFKSYYGDMESNYFSFGNNKLTVFAQSDTDLPILQSIKFDKTNVSINEKVKIIIKASDNNAVDYPVISFENEDFINDDVTFNYDKATDSYIGYVSFAKAGKYKINYIDIIDKATNSNRYYSKDTNYEWVSSSQKLKEDYIINVSGGSNDNEGPKLLNVYLNKTEVVAPSFVKVYIDAVDEGSGIKSIQASFTTEQDMKNGLNKSYFIDDIIFDNTTSKYVGIFNVDQYSTGKFLINNITLIDNQNNKSIYNYLDNDNNKLSEYSFNIKEEFKYDLVTSTVDDDIISRINNTKDDAIIMIDSTNNYKISKDIFKSIKGTNKTIYIETGGIQWVFNGKDIKKPKDIMVNVLVDVFYNDNLGENKEDYIALVFYDNGRLPGKAKIRVKTDYTFKYSYGVKDLISYYYNDKEDKYKLQNNKINLTNDGFYEFDISHNSTYVLSNKKIDNKLITNSDYLNNDSNMTNSNDDSNDNSSKLLLIGICCSVFVLIFLIIIIKIKKGKKKKHN